MNFIVWGNHNVRNCVKELQHSEGCEPQSQKKRGLTLDSPETLEILNLATASLLIWSKERRCDCTALVKQKSSDNESITKSQGFYRRISVVWSLLGDFMQLACARRCPDPFHRLQQMLRSPWVRIISISVFRWGNFNVGSKSCMPEPGSSMRTIWFWFISALVWLLISEAFLIDLFSQCC